MEKDLTLLVPMYNKAPYIDRMVKSLSEQTYLDQTKIIVCDDKSTDNSIEVLSRAAKKYHVQMTLFMNEENLGLSRTIRNLYRKIETDFWAVLDPDDYYVHSERLSKAVDFLKAHPDFSMHGCNFALQDPDGRTRAAYPLKAMNLDCDNYERMPFVQTSAGTFRNFWTAEILNYIDDSAGNRRVHFTQGDGFRNFVAIHFGKLHIENFIGSLYSIQAGGMYTSLTDFERSLMSIQSSLDLAGFERDFFHDQKTLDQLLHASREHYIEAVNFLNEMMLNFSAGEFRAKKYAMDVLRLKSDNILAVVEYLVETGKFFKSTGVSRIK